MKYYVDATFTLTNSENISQFNTSDYVSVNIIENKPTVTIEHAYISSYYFDNEENFIAEVSAEISNDEPLSFTLGIPYRRSYTTSTTIRLTKDEYENLYNDLDDYGLSNFVVVVAPTSEMYESYYIVDKSFSFNLKEKIDELKEGQASTNTPPIANAGGDQNAITNVSLVLDGSHSYDDDGDTLTYQWVMTNSAGGNVYLTNGTTSQATFRTDREGVYTIQLAVNDGKDFSLC